MSVCLLGSSVTQLRRARAILVHRALVVREHSFVILSLMSRNKRDSGHSSKSWCHNGWTPFTNKDQPTKSSYSGWRRKKGTEEHGVALRDTKENASELSSTYKKNTQTNIKVHDHNQKTIQALHSLAEECAELLHGDSCCLVVVALETGGRWSQNVVDYVAGQLPAHEATPLLRSVLGVEAQMVSHGCNFVRTFATSLTVVNTFPHALAGVEFG